MADCGTCESSCKKAEKKAACKMEAAKCEMKATQDKAACEMKGAKDKAACEMKADKTSCEVPDKSCEQAQEKSKKWWKFGLGK